MCVSCVQMLKINTWGKKIQHQKSLSLINNSLALHLTLRQKARGGTEQFLTNPGQPVEGWCRLPLPMSLFCLTEPKPPHLSKVPDVKQVKSLEQLTLLHAEHIAARRQEGPDVLQAQELWEEQRLDWKGANTSGVFVHHLFILSGVDWGRGTACHQRCGASHNYQTRSHRGHDEQQSVQLHSIVAHHKWTHLYLQLQTEDNTQPHSEFDWNIE